MIAGHAGSARKRITLLVSSCLFLSFFLALFSVFPFAPCTFLTTEELRMEGNPLRRPRMKVLVETGLKGIIDWCKHETDTIQGVRTRGQA